jgi:NO-binding membrane sensor protein with MHYT domain
MGLGIWAMHYIGMLAFSMPMLVLYDSPTVGLSLVAAIGASAVTLFVVSRQTMGRRREIFGSIIMGSGIAAMHYIGMAAMRVPARINYSPGIVALSIVLAVVISLVALILTFRVRDEKRTSLRKIISALVMGSAIPLMHYTGMAAVSFSPSDEMPDLSHAVGISHLGIAAISITSLLVLILALLPSSTGCWPRREPCLMSHVRANHISEDWLRQFLRSSGRHSPMAKPTTSTNSGATTPGSIWNKAAAMVGSPRSMRTICPCA